MIGHFFSGVIILGLGFVLGMKRYLAGALPLVICGLSFLGQRLVLAFVGVDSALARDAISVLLLCAGISLLVALQNALQGLWIGEGRTARVNGAVWLGSTLLLGSAAAALTMVVALAAETAWLSVGLRGRVPSPAL